MKIQLLFYFWHFFKTKFQRISLIPSVLSYKSIQCILQFHFPWSSFKRPLCDFRYAGLFWHSLGHVLCLHQWLVADQRASAAGLHRRRPPVRQEAPGDRLRPQHPRQPRPHRPAPSRRPRQRGDMPPAAQVRRRPAGDGLPREYGVALVWPRGYHTVPGVQRVKDRYLVRMWQLHTSFYLSGFACVFQCQLQSLPPLLFCFHNVTHLLWILKLQLSCNIYVVPAATRLIFRSLVSESSVFLVVGFHLTGWMCVKRIYSTFTDLPCVGVHSNPDVAMAKHSQFFVHFRLVVSFR